MIQFPNFNPIALQLGPLKVRWYGIMYLLSFAIAWLLAKKRSRLLGYQWNNEIIGDFIFYCALGVIIGGRLGFVLFYGLSSFLADPISIFETWHGGMSFHGGLIGVIISLWLFGRKVKLPLIAMFDFTAPLVPLGLALGRIGNFINNGELWGHVTTVPWGMVFPYAGPLPRHPSQLYEASLEGAILFIIIWFYAAKPRKPGMVSALFLCGYGTARFLCEFFREPDIQIGFLAGNWFTMGQLLSIPMVLAGLIIFFIVVLKRIEE